MLSGKFKRLSRKDFAIQATEVESTFYRIRNIFSQMYFLVPFVFILTTMAGLMYYHVAHRWEFSTSFFYTVQVLCTNVYGVPPESNFNDRAFTVALYVWGSTMVAAAVGALARSVVENAVNKARSHKHHDGHHSASHLNRILEAVGWYDHKSKYLTIFTTTCYIAVGIAYGIFYEGWDFKYSLLFSVDAISTAGTLSLPCFRREGITDCQLGTFRGFFIGFYLVFGVPLFTFTLGQFSGLIVEHAVAANEEEKMLAPITEQEYHCASKLNSVYENSLNEAADDEKIDLSEFVILQMLRLKRISMEEVESIRDLFLSIDEDKSGEIDRQELINLGLYKPSKDCKKPNKGCNELDNISSVSSGSGNVAYGSMPIQTSSSLVEMIRSNN